MGELVPQVLILALWEAEKVVRLIKCAGAADAVDELVFVSITLLHFAKHVGNSQSR
jgi:hypothetical protein